MAREWRFADAAAWLKQLPDGPARAMRASLMIITEAAAVFVNDIQQDLAAEPFTGELTLADGGVAKRVLVDDGGNIRLTMGNGEVRSCAWRDFPPDAMIAMHRVLVRKPHTETERLRRHECAIAFDWLVGNRERALAAADNIAQSNNTFKKRWETISKDLPE
jgi:hypothetical protein